MSVGMPLLTKVDEARLAQAIEAGRSAQTELAGTKEVAPSRRHELQRLVRRGYDATDAFVTANLRLVVSIAKRYQAGELPLLDLI
jgi:DNA-directed RNA polymerase sigma subunit (sigma70/sigma32)